MLLDALAGAPAGLGGAPAFELNWNLFDDGTAFGLFATPSCPVFATFGLELTSGSSDLRLTPATALFGVSLAPFVGSFG